MDKFILRLVINGFGLYAAVALIPGIVPQSANPVSYVWLAVIFGAFMNWNFMRRLGSKPKRAGWGWLWTAALWLNIAA